MNVRRLEEPDAEWFDKCYRDLIRAGLVAFPLSIGLVVSIGLLTHGNPPHHLMMLAALPLFGYGLFGMGRTLVDRRREVVEPAPLLAPERDPGP